MRFLSLTLLFTVSFTVLQAQPPAKPIKKVLELKIPREGGANGASVAWHPVLKRYYAAMAGNITYCLAVFDVTGKRISQPDLSTNFDVRGLWYNPKTKTLQMNGYNDFGWGEYKLNSKGFPDSVKILHNGMNQPSEQSIGTFNPLKNVVYFLNDEGNLDVYDYKDGLYQENIELTLGKTKKDAEQNDEEHTDDESVLDDYNSAIVYTGIPGSEIGIFNHIEKQVELYNLKDGHLVRKIVLPGDAPVNTFLNFAYTNGIWWLFDKDARIWKGYK